MAASLDDSGCWLPTHFRAGEEKLKPHESFDCEPDLCFPTEFPYEVNSPVGSSTETDSSDEDDFLAGLTRRFAQNLAGHGFRDKPEKQRVSGGSPQSTLNGIGSWSPPATPFGFSNDTFGLIYAAAGEVARLKMSREAANLCNNNQNRGLLGPHLQFHQFPKHDRTVAPPCPAVPWPTTQHHHHHHQTYNTVRGPFRTQNQNLETHSQQNNPGIRPGFAGGKVAKRESAGTGVFLPRRYTIPSEIPKKAGRTPVLVPAKVVQALNLNFNGHAQPRAADLSPDHEALLARRNALFLQQRAMMAATEAREVRLPQEWTY